MQIWGTKGIAFWAIFEAILLRAQPRSILEIGGGRSSVTVHDYAAWAQVPAVTIEESADWCAKIRHDLHCMHLEAQAEQVIHVPLVWDDMALWEPNMPADTTTALDEPGPQQWYDYARFMAAAFHRPWDCVFVDGPVSVARANPRGQRAISCAAWESRLIIVDDIHRDYNRRLFVQMAHAYECLEYAYADNLLGLAVCPEWAHRVRDCFQFLRIPYQPCSILS